MQKANLQIILKERLRNAKKVALLGVGSELRADDVAGLKVAQALVKFRPKKIHFKVFIGETAPENLTGEIRKFKPTHLILVDSVDAKKKPGSFFKIEPEESTGVSFCTHRLPIKILTDYLAKELNCDIVILGIQPKNLAFAKDPSPIIEKSVKEVVRIIKGSL